MVRLQLENGVNVQDKDVRTALGEAATMDHEASAAPTRKPRRRRRLGCRRADGAKWSGREEARGGGTAAARTSPPACSSASSFTCYIHLARVATFGWRIGGRLAGMFDSTEPTDLGRLPMVPFLISFSISALAFPFVLVRFGVGVVGSQSVESEGSSG